MVTWLPVSIKGPLMLSLKRRDATSLQLSRRVIVRESQKSLKNLVGRVGVEPTAR